MCKYPGIVQIHRLPDAGGVDSPVRGHGRKCLVLRLQADFQALRQLADAVLVNGAVLLEMRFIFPVLFGAFRLKFPDLAGFPFFMKTVRSNGGLLLGHCFGLCAL